MDPFLGMGSTALACAELEIPFLGFEIDQEYFKICRERLRGFIQDKEECLL
jgi:site-specific DNA-methyltransferase (adenine-specific)